MEFIIKYRKGVSNPFGHPNNDRKTYEPGYYIHIHWHHSRKFDLAYDYRWEDNRIHYGPYANTLSVITYLSSIYDKVKNKHDKVGCCIYLEDEHRSIYYGYYLNYASHILNGQHFEPGTSFKGYPFGWGRMVPNFGNRDGGWNNHLATKHTEVQRHPSGGFAIYGD